MTKTLSNWPPNHEPTPRMMWRKIIAIPATVARAGSRITRRRVDFEKIARLARYDSLTGLPNRLMLIEATGAALRRAAQAPTRCAFLMIDLDRFKAVNDTTGHLAGDRLLQLAAARLMAVIGKNQLCARLGGDEFCILLPDAADPAGASRMAQTVIDRLSEPYAVDNQTLHIGASVGAALSGRDGDTVEALMRGADLALYRAKGLGGGQYCLYGPALLAQAQERHRLELALRDALDRNEFRLVFQPVVDALDERVVSFEALLRWQNPELGAVAPARFLPLAEATRLIVPIGNWVMHQACRQAMRWPPHISVAVNVSGEQLVDPGFSDGVASALAMADLAPRRLEIEVTESIFLHDAGAARMALERVMALGCTVALNNFGTGFSALGEIHKLRFSTIKLDRSFIQGAATGNPESLAVLRAVVAIAESRDMPTTAEGVETPSELALARSLGCERIQGFYYGRPMSGEKVMRLFGDTRELENSAAN